MVEQSPYVHRTEQDRILTRQERILRREIVRMASEIIWQRDGKTRLEEVKIIRENDDWCGNDDEDNK